MNSQQTSSIDPTGGGNIRNGHMSGARLPFLYQEIFTAAVRVHLGRDTISSIDAFRQNLRRALNDVVSQAAQLPYEKDDVIKANFAVIAFVDELVINCEDPAHTQWATRPLANDLFGAEGKAGEWFFDRLEMLLTRRDSQELADLLEVHYTCLLLGYKGRFARRPQEELSSLASTVKDRIRGMRHRRLILSPAGFPRHSELTLAPNIWFKRLGVTALGVVILTIVLFCSLWLALSKQSDDIRSKVQRSYAL